jgi:hypothetical protein
MLPFSLSFLLSFGLPPLLTLALIFGLPPPFSFTIPFGLRLSVRLLLLLLVGWALVTFRSGCCRP